MVGRSVGVVYVVGTIILLPLMKSMCDITLGCVVAMVVQKVPKGLYKFLRERR